MTAQLQAKIIGALIVAGCVFGVWFWAATRYDAGVADGRQLERSAYRQTSDAAVLKRDFEFLHVKSQLAEERANREKDKTEHAAKFEKYLADARAGRIPEFNGLRVKRSDLCPPRTEETTGTARAEDQESARLPRALEENLFRFANDRDEIIAAFEGFKQDVRIAGCFKTDLEP